MTPEDFQQELSAIIATGDGWRWQMAQRIAAAKDADVRGWLEIACVEARRKRRTIHEWVQLWHWSEDYTDFRAKLGFSFMVAAMKAADKIEPDALRELLETFAGERGATLDDFKAEVAAIANEEPPFDAEKYLSRRVQDLRDHADMMPSPTDRDRVLKAADVLCGVE